MLSQFSGKVISKQRIPSPSTRIQLFLVTYWSEGLKVKGYLAEPNKEGRLPGLLYLRGGIKSVGMVRKSRIIQYASEGFIVFAPFYRGNQGGEGREDFAGLDRMDGIHGFHLLKEHSRVDENSIHLIGFSRGGAMALFVAIAQKSVRSVVCWNGVSDMVLTYEERIDLRKMLKRVIGGTPSKKRDAYEWRTPLYQLDKLEAPILIIHGKKDEHVSFRHATLLEEKLKDLNKRVETYYFEEEGHVFTEPLNRQVVTRLTSWMKLQTNNEEAP